MILAGRPGMGKTSLATNIAYNAASRWLRDNADGIPPEKNMGAKTAFFSLEMSADQHAGGKLIGGHFQVEERSEEHTSELQSIMRSSYAVFFFKKKKQKSILYQRDTIIRF